MSDTVIACSIHMVLDNDYNGKISVDWKVEGSGRWKVEGGRWKVEGGRWKVEGGRWKVEGRR